MTTREDKQAAVRRALGITDPRNVDMATIPQYNKSYIVFHREADVYEVVLRDYTVGGIRPEISIAFVSNEQDAHKLGKAASRKYVELFGKPLGIEKGKGLNGRHTAA